MSDVVKIKADSLFPMIQEIVAQGQNVRVAVSGSSMYPFLRDGVDSVEFIQAAFSDLSRGDVVLIRRKDGPYIMHRVLKKGNDSFYMVGDAQQWVEGPLYPDQVIAKAHAVWRNNKRIPADRSLWRVLAECWLILLPWRGKILQVYNGVKRRLLPG